MSYICKFSHMHHLAKREMPEINIVELPDHLAKKFIQVDGFIQNA